MKKLQNFIIIIGVFLFVGLNDVAAQDPPPPPGDPPPSLPIGDNIQYIVIIAVVFGLFIIYNKIEKQNSLLK